MSKYWTNLYFLKILDIHKGKWWEFCIYPFEIQVINSSNCLTISIVILNVGFYLCRDK